MLIALPDRAPIDDATRRDFLIGGVSLAALLASCSTATPASEPPAASTGFPVTINHKYGSTEITKVPKRVVSVGLTEQDTLLALGVIPVATREWFGEQPGALWPWARAAAGDAPVPEVLAYELNYEKIAALRPDLILGVSWGVTEQEYPKLSQIAPTVAQSADFVDGGTPWQDQTWTIGRTLGQEQRATQLVADVEARFAQARQEHPQFLGASVVAAYDFGDGDFGVYGPQDPRARILTSLGFEVPPRLVELVGNDYYAQISAEQLGLVDADALVWLVYTEAGASRVRDQPLYQNARRCKGRARPVPAQHRSGGGRLHVQHRAEPAGRHRRAGPAARRRTRWRPRDHSGAAMTGPGRSAGGRTGAAGCGVSATSRRSSARPCTSRVQPRRHAGSVQCRPFQEAGAL